MSDVVYAVVVVMLILLYGIRDTMKQTNKKKTIKKTPINCITDCTSVMLYTFTARRLGEMLLSIVNQMNRLTYLKESCLAKRETSPSK